MSKKNCLLISFLSALFFTASCKASKNISSGASLKNSPASVELYNSIAHMDSVLFNAFNSRDIEKLKKLFTEDLEFYHDKGGLTNYTQNMEAFKNTAAKNNDLRRELIPGSLEVYPIKEYGAMEIGQHRFCHTENGKPDCGTFKFVHIWKKINNEWKISRVISYGH
jgi:ketosteroid isomerase-like protein